MDRRRAPEIARNAGMVWRIAVAVGVGWAVLTGVPALIYSLM